jgi:GNAT superfamily N-acetyltransferase
MRATTADIDRVAQILHAEPGAEAIAFMGNVELARRYGEALVRRDGIPNPARSTVVAQRAGEVVGVLQYALGSGRAHGRLEHMRVLASVVGPFGVVRRLPAIRARARVEIAVPPASFHIANLHVDAAHHSEGIGNELLEWAEWEAIRVGARRMVLITTTTNPARPWYERHGFVPTVTATDGRYERYAGVPGRVLLEKSIARTR